MKSWILIYPTFAGRPLYRYKVVPLINRLSLRIDYPFFNYKPDLLPLLIIVYSIGWFIKSHIVFFKVFKMTLSSVRMVWEWPLDELINFTLILWI